MKTIYKYELFPTTVVRLPQDAEILTVQVQGQTAVLWVLLDPERRREQTRTLIAYPTGGEIPDAVQARHYVGTFQTHGLVYHVFETTDIPGESYGN